MTSSAHDADLKGNNFRRAIHPQSFISLGVAPPPVTDGRKKPGLDTVNSVPVIFYHYRVAFILLPKASSKRLIREAKFRSFQLPKFSKCSLFGFFYLFPCIYDNNNENNNDRLCLICITLVFPFKRII